MSKLLLLFVVFCLAVTVITGRSTNTGLTSSDKLKCGRHGDPCTDSSQCCDNVKMQCHRFAGRCQVVITQDEIMKQREKILGRKGKDY